MFVDSNSRVPNNLQQQQQQRKMTGLRDATEAQTLLGSFILFDIMACASTRSSPSLNLDHQRVLKTSGINLEDLFGCENRVVSLILDVVHLDNWRKRNENTYQLSMVELVKRGAKIEDNISQYIESIESSKNLVSDVSGRRSNTLSTAQTEITAIFALSALTYLHVVISGAHPELPEISNTVTRTIDVFKNLSDPRLLRHLVWPFCITGCLATEGQQSSFRDLVTKAEITSSTVETCLQALDIVEECWEIRKTSLYNCDWVFIMNERGWNTLLM